MNPKLHLASEVTQLTTATHDVDLHLIERFNRGYFSGVTEAALAALAAYDQEVAAAQASADALEAKKGKVRGKQSPGGEEQARDEILRGGNGRVFTELRSALARKEEVGYVEGRDLVNLLKCDPPRTLAEQTAKILERMNAEEVLRGVHFDPHKPTPEALDLYKMLVEAASELLNGKGEVQGPTAGGQSQFYSAVIKPLTGRVKFKRSEFAQGHNPKHVSARWTLDAPYIEGGPNEARNFAEIDPNEILLIGSEEVVHFDALARDLFRKYMVEPRELNIRLAKLLAEWITKNHNPTVHNQLDLLNELDKALSIKEIELHEPAPNTAKEPWESDAFKAVLPTFREGAAQVFKKEWLAAATKAAAEGKEPVLIQGEAIDVEKLAQLQKDQVDRQALEGLPAMIRWFKQLFEATAATPKDEITVSTAVKQLYSAYEQALQIHEVGAQLTQLSGKTDVETHKRGMELLALGHALTFVLKTRSVGVAAQLAAGVLNENSTMTDALLDLAELVHSNPTEDLNAILDEVSDRTAAVLEVAGAGAHSKATQAQHARKQKA